MILAAAVWWGLGCLVAARITPWGDRRFYLARLFRGTRAGAVIGAAAAMALVSTLWPVYLWLWWREDQIRRYFYDSMGVPRDQRPRPGQPNSSVRPASIAGGPGDAGAAADRPAPGCDPVSRATAAIAAEANARAAERRRIAAEARELLSDADDLLG